MLSKIITWDIYEIIPESSLVTGVKMRGRIRKFGLEAGRNVLVENVEDIDNRVRFAVPSGRKCFRSHRVYNRTSPRCKKSYKL